MEEKAFHLIKEALCLHSAISPSYLQCKLKIEWSEACHLIRKFLLEYKVSSEVDLSKPCVKDNTNLLNFTQVLNPKKENPKNMIVVIGGVKGGVGKSTLAINLVTILASKGKKVLFVDADKIRSSSKFVQHRNNKKIPTSWTTVCLQNNQVSTEVLKLRPQFDEVVIDVGGGDSVSQRHAFGIADVLIAPFKPSFPDIETLDDLREVVVLAKPFNPKLRVYGILNQADRRGRTNDQGRKFLTQENFLTCLNSIITNRVSIRNSWSAGLGVVEMKPQDEKAVTEITNFYKEIYEPA